MTDAYEHSARPGSASLTILSFVGLGAFSTFLWQVSPSMVMLLMIPALLVCLWQIIKMPIYGIRMTHLTWHVMGGRDDLVIPTSKISYMRLAEYGSKRQISLMLRDGTEVILPEKGLPSTTDLIREATNRNIPVRDLTSRG